MPRELPLLCLGLAITAAAAACSSETPSPDAAPAPAASPTTPARPGDVAPPVVLLVSLDTTRADALSAYGGEGARTPVLDRLAAGGARFSLAIAQSPTTLASHSSALSGLDSHGHRVVRNGYPLPEDVPLATERFQEAGWDTVAVVGAYALEADMGLDRGFRVYEDSDELAAGGNYMVPADRVTQLALQAVDARPSDGPLFLFVHYYDPHMQWVHAPEELRQQFIDPAYAGPAGNTPEAHAAMTRATQAGRLTAADLAQARAYYLAEVTWTDGQLGRLLQGLSDRGLLEEALVVVMSDHGEIFDEVPARPFQHGPDVDLAVSHVPLLAWGSGRFDVPDGTVVDDLVRVQDVAATLLSQAGLDGAIGESRDLSVTWRPGAGPLAPAAAFIEATRPHAETRTDAWPNLDLERGVAFDGHFYTRAPWLDQHPEPAQGLFRLDSGQTPVEDPAVEARLAALLAGWDAAAPGHREERLDDETRAALQALGYIGDADQAPVAGQE